MQIPQRFVQHDVCVCAKGWDSQEMKKLELRLIRCDSSWFVVIFEHFPWKEADVVPWPIDQFHRHRHNWKMQACKHQKILLSTHTKTKLANRLNSHFFFCSPRFFRFSSGLWLLQSLLWISQVLRDMPQPMWLAETSAIWSCLNKGRLYGLPYRFCDFLA